MLFRLAPTPSGYLHLGNAVNFVLTWVAARQRGASILLRIDDLDADRKRPEYIDDVFRTINFLGLDYDLGPTSPGDFDRRWSQRHRLDRYADTLNRLRQADALYACGLSRRDLQAYGAAYPPEGRQQGLPLDAPDVAWRFRAAGDGSADFVVRRRDGLPAYQIASLTDDVDFGVTHLIRGVDLVESTSRQCQLAGRAGYRTFLDTHVWHHEVVLSMDTGHKLAKSAGSGDIGPDSLRAMQLRSEGPERVYRVASHFIRSACHAMGLLEATNTTSETSRSLLGLLTGQAIPDDLFTLARTVTRSYPYC